MRLPGEGKNRRNLAPSRNVGEGYFGQVPSSRTTQNATRRRSLARGVIQAEGQRRPDGGVLRRKSAPLPNYCHVSRPVKARPRVHAQSRDRHVAAPCGSLPGQAPPVCHILSVRAAEIRDRRSRLREPATLRQACNVAALRPLVSSKDFQHLTAASTNGRSTCESSPARAGVGAADTPSPERCTPCSSVGGTWPPIGMAARLSVSQHTPYCMAGGTRYRGHPGRSLRGLGRAKSQLHLPPAAAQKKRRRSSELRVGSRTKGHRHSQTPPVPRIGRCAAPLCARLPRYRGARAHLLFRL